MATDKEFMPKIESVRIRYRFAKAKQILKGMWELMPLMWVLNLLSRAIIAASTIHYLDSIGSLTLMVHIVLTLWTFAPLYGIVNNTWYTFRELRMQWELDKLNDASGEQDE